MRVVILTGGSTPERAVALAGAGQVASALRTAGFVVRVVDVSTGPVAVADEATLLDATVGTAPPSPDELAALRARENLPALMALPEIRGADVVFPVLHGLQGEGGRVQSLLELAGIPFAGSDSLGSVLAMDKDTTKRLLRDAGIPTGEWALWPCSPEALAALGRPLVVKPSRAGSTVGLSVVAEPREPQAVATAVERARAYDSIVLVERFLPGRELTCGVLAGRALAVGEIVTDSGIFDTG